MRGDAWETEMKDYPNPDACSTIKCEIPKSTEGPGTLAEIAGRLAKTAEMLAKTAKMVYRNSDES